MTLSWNSVFWGLSTLLVIYLLSKAIRVIWRYCNTLAVLNVDTIDVLKRLKDNTLEEYLKSKYKEKEELLRFKILKFLRDRITNEEDEEEKAFLRCTIELFEDSENEWQIIEFIKTLGGYYSISFGRWKKVWGRAETSTVIEILITYDYKNGGLEERHQVKNLPEPILKEISTLQLCRNVIF